MTAFGEPRGRHFLTQAGAPLLTSTRPESVDLVASVASVASVLVRKGRAVPRRSLPGLGRSVDPREVTPASPWGAASEAGEWDVFVGHLDVDRAWAEWIAWQLTVAGHRVLVQPWDFVPGTEPAERIKVALLRATRVVVVLSPASVRSSRLGTADRRDGWPAEVLNRLLAVRVARCDRPGVPAGVAHVDVFDVSEMSAQLRLQRAILKGQPARVEPVLPSRRPPGGAGADASSGAVRPAPQFPSDTSATPGPVEVLSGAVSAYRQLVARIAPAASPGLMDQDGGLRELATFCTEPDGDSYLWWQAPAWAGVSTVLADFVIHPPLQIRDRTAIAPYFVTTRLAGQDTRAAFMSCVLEQLSELGGLTLPPALNAAVLEEQLRFQLTHAPAICANQGRRLVLVVDGLDGERAASTGGDARSIAGLLPANPLYGMRIIVTGRPGAAIPDDVPAGHPLRDPRIVRHLQPSPDAEDVGRRTRDALHRLLTGTTIQQDLLGLLVAARGSLSARDLNDLTGAPAWVTDETLQAVAGHGGPRPGGSPPRPEAGPGGYLLAHEELQTTAAESLGEQRLAGYRARLHAWADVHRARGWPAGTPDYLLREYHHLLAATRDLPRLFACATDTARHERMHELPGGRATARSETRTAFGVNAEQDHPDLVTAVRLAYHRDLVTERDTPTPSVVPSVGSLLGDIVPAGAPVGEVGPYARARTVTTVAEALARPDGLDHAGDLDRAALAAHVETRIRQVNDPHVQGLALAVLAGAPDPARHPDPDAALVARIASAARAITSARGHVEALAAVAQALLRTGRPGRATALALHAETVARALLDDHQLGLALAAVAPALAEAGRPDRAVALVAEIESLAPAAHPRAWVTVAQALAHAGHPGQAADLALGTDALARPPALARTSPDPHRPAHPLAAVARALAEAGLVEQAETTARRIIDPYQRVGALAVVAGTLARTGHRDRAMNLGVRAEVAARTLSDPYRQAHALAAAAQALAEAGNPDRATALATEAETLARTIIDPTQHALRTRALLAVALALVHAERPDRATALAVQAEITHRTMADPYPEPQDLTAVAQALARSGHPDHAQTVARTISDLYRQAEALLVIARVLVETGSRPLARRLVAEAAVAVPWPRLVAVLLSLEPSASTAVLDLSHGIDRHSAGP